MSDSHEDHARSHVQTSDRTGDTYVHINNGQGSLHRMGCDQLWLVFLWVKPSWPVTGGGGGGGRITSPCRFMSLFFLILFELMTSSSSSRPSSVLNMHRPFYWHEMLFPSNQLKRLCVCACVCVLFICPVCAFSVSLQWDCVDGLTERMRHSLFFYIHVMQYGTSTILLV